MEKKPKNLTGNYEFNDITLQLNFYIIRTVYDIVNGFVSCNANPQVDFYHLLDISRSSYDKLVSTGERCKKHTVKVAEWSLKTGIAQVIFKGEQYFEIKGCNMLQYINEILICDDDRIKTIKKEIRTALTRDQQTPQLDKNLKALFHFARTKSGSTRRQETATKTLSIFRNIQAVSIKDLETLTIDELSTYSETIEKHLELAKAVLLIKSNIT